MSMRTGIVLTSLVAALLPVAAHAAPPPHAIVTGHTGWPEVRAWSATGTRARAWAPDGHSWPLGIAVYPTYEKGVRVAVADVTGDGRAEVVAAPASDAWASVEIFDGRTYERLTSLPPWPRGSWWGGVDVAAADATGDGRAEVVVGLGPGGCTAFHVWNVATRTRIGDAFPFGTASEAGARVAAADVSGDGRAEVLVAPIGGGRVGVHAASGGAAFRSFVPFGGAPAELALAAGDVAGDARAELVAAAMTESGAHVKVLDAVTGASVASFFPFGTSPASALEVAVADVDGNGGRDVVAAAATPEGTRVVAVSLDGRTLASFYALEPGLAPGASLAAGDLDGDGTAEIVLGTGPTTAPAAPATGPEQVIAVFDADGRVRGRFAAFPGRFQGAVRVASGDVTGSSRPELVTSPGPGTAAEIGVYTDAYLPERDRNHRLSRFLAFEPSFLGGATVAVGDVDGDRAGEIVVGSGPGRVGEVLVLDARGERHVAVFPFGETYDGGLSVAAGDLDADGRAEIVASTLEAPPRIRVYGGDGGRRYLLLPAGLETPVEVAVADLDGDGRSEIVAGATEGAVPRVDVFDGATGAHRLGIVAYGAAFTGGVHVAAADLDSDGRDEIAVGPGNGGDGRLLILDRRLRRVRSWSPWPWSWPGVHVAITQRYGLPLVAVPRTSQVRRGARRPFVVASFRDVAADRATFRSSIRWGDGRTSATAVRPRGRGRYDVVASRPFARPGRYAATVTLSGADGRRAIARSIVLVRR